MIFRLGIKTDPVEYRFSYEWLFALMERMEVRYLQLASSFEMYGLPDRYFLRLREQAEDRGVHIISCFTAHRELGGLLMEDPDLRKVAMDGYRRYIEIGALVGAISVGSNPGMIYRDQMDTKPAAIERYLSAMEELRRYADDARLQALTLETMSTLAEPPTTRAEISYFMERLNPPAGTRSGVPVYICGDVSHGWADESGAVVESNLELFEHGIPWIWEFHIKNTDARFESTFGFGPVDLTRGIVDLKSVAEIVNRNVDRFPRDEVLGILEIPGPKLGRDYSDRLLEGQLVDSLIAIKRDMIPALDPAFAVD